MNGEKCVRCGDMGDDRRTLWMACLYAMNELDVPFGELQTKVVIERQQTQDRLFYTLRVCKECRADWMTAIVKWFHAPIKRESPGSGIYIRRNGATVEISDEEWRRMHPDREPVRFIPEKEG